MRVEGIYESQVPIEFRALLELGCCCRLKSDNFSTSTSTAVELDQLETVSFHICNKYSVVVVNNFRIKKFIEGLRGRISTGEEYSECILL